MQLEQDPSHSDLEVQGKRPSSLERTERARPPQQPTRFSFDRILRVLLGFGFTAILGGVIVYYFSSLVIYLLIGSVVAYLMHPLVDRIQGIGLARIPAIAVTFVLVLSVLSLLLMFLVPFVGRQISDLTQQIRSASAVQITRVLPASTAPRGSLVAGDFVRRINDVEVHRYDELQAFVRDKSPGEQIWVLAEDNMGNRRTVTLTLREADEAAESQGSSLQTDGQGRILETLGLQLRTVVFSDLLLSIENQVNDLVPVREGIVVDAITGVSEALVREERIAQIFSWVVGFFTNVFYALLVIPFVTFFMLKDGASIRHSLLQLVPNRYFEITLAINEKLGTNLGRYFRGLLLQSLFIGTTAWVLLSLAGLNYALAVGIFAGLANTIPYFGPLMGFLAGTFVGVAQTGDFSLIPGILLAMGLTQVADNVLFQPLIFSRATQAHPLVILFVVLIGAQIAGIIGMLIAIPLTTVLRVTVQQIVWSLRNYRILQPMR